MSYTINRIKDAVRNSYWSYTYTPTDAIIFLTYRCTSKCKACNIWKRKVNIEDELTWEQWEPILENLAKSNIRSVELFGGDALLRKDVLVNMARFCRDNNIYTFFPTNSSSLTEKTIEDLVEAGLGTIYFSLDEAPDSDVSIRGVKRHYERVEKSIKLLKKARGDRKKPRIVCITTVSSMNYRHLEILTETAYELGADEHEIHGITEFTTKAVEESSVDGILPDPYFMPTDGKSHSFSEQEAKELMEILERTRQRKDKYLPMKIYMANMEGRKIEDFTELTYPHQTCLFATTQVVISPYGDVQPCLYYKDYQLGNLKNQNLSEIWGNDKHKLFCEQQQKHEIPLCDHCGNKLYHKSFIPVMKDISRGVIRKLSIS